MADHARRQLGRIWFRAVFAAGLVGVVILGATWLAYLWERSQTLRAAELELAEISRYKALQLRDWRNRYVDEGHLIARSPLLYETLSSPSREASAALLDETFRHVAESLELSELLVCRPDASPVFLLPGSALRASDEANIESCLANGAPLLRDIVRYEGDRFSLDLYVPIAARKGGTPYCLILRRDAARNLFPILQAWPRPSATAESLLARREGDAVVFISPLLKARTDPLDFKIPLSRDELPAVRSVLGERGPFIGRDYRGASVVSYVDQVEGSPWGLVVKVDAAEAYAPLRERMVYLGAISTAMLFLCVVLVLLLFSRRQGVVYRRLFSLAEERARLNQEFAATLLGIGDGVISTDAGGRVRWLNDAAAGLLGRSREVVLGRAIDEVFVLRREDGTEAGPSPVSQVLSTGTIHTLEGRNLLVLPEGEVLPIADSAAPIRTEDGSLAGAVLVFHDARAERDLERAEAARTELYSRLFTDSATCALIVDPEGGHIVDGNRAAQAFYGLDAKALRSLRIFDLNVEDGEEVGTRLARVARGDVQSFQTRHRAAGGEIREVMVYTGPITVGDRSLIFSVMIDVTAQVAAQAAREALLREKEVLLRELHHRTKNNLQVVSALVALEADQIQDPRMQEFVASMQGRIETMALAHEKLYRSADVAQIDLGAYLGELAVLVAQDAFDLRLELAAAPVSVDAASPCGLVVNELLTNSRKYAFPEGRRGLVTLGLLHLPLGGLRLSYRDNGVGLPLGFDPAQATTLGLALVSSIAREQLLGTIAFGEAPGFSCAIEFDPRAMGPPR